MKEENAVKQNTFTNNETVEFGTLVDEILLREYGKTAEQSDTTQLAYAVSKTVMDAIREAWAESREKHAGAKRAFYFSAEYLVGRAVYNNLYCTGLRTPAADYFKKRGLDLARFEEIEDAALGNGGLGRLAACFLDSAATKGVPLDGYGIRYRYGAFAQTFENGFQREKADDWQRFGDPFSIRREDEAVAVTIAGRRVLAVPYDMPVIGYGAAHVATLRLWQSEAPEGFDLDAFNRQDYAGAFAGKNAAEVLCAVLYPNDDTDEGKALRLRQEYFFTSASLKDILRNYKKSHDSLASFAGDCAIQLNDTHPVVAIPELIRLLMQEESFEFGPALEIAKNTFAYTNHTVMPEAAEKWEARLFQNTLPEVFSTIEKIDDAARAELAAMGVACEAMENYAVLDGGTVHMARLAVYATHHTNGVAAIHTQILQNGIFRDWYKLYPERFSNKTNGVTQRRWLGLCNPELCDFISRRIGNGFLTNSSELKKLEPYCGDPDSLRELRRVKQIKKRQLADFIAKREGVLLDPDFLFDIQIKRLHEYKRQLLNAFSILSIYYGIKEGRIRDFVPTAFLFGGKAAPGYYRAKGIIKYIHEVAEMIRRDPAVRDLLNVVFVTDYDVSYAEKLVAAADISEQISTAGTEASGTGNMKFMLNGAVTLGTCDGANVEIVEKAGMENNYIFGLRVGDIERIRPTYDPLRICESDPLVRLVAASLGDGTFSDGGTGHFEDLRRSLFEKTDGGTADPYFLMADFLPYLETRLRANRDYADAEGFSRKCLANIANAGYFSSDRTILEYAREIWGVEPVL